MTLQDALAIHLYLQAVDTIEEREERVSDAAWKIIERQARKAIGSFPANGPVQARSWRDCSSSGRTEFSSPRSRRARLVLTCSGPRATGASCRSGLIGLIGPDGQRIG